ncbi:hypothetical protein ACHAXA_009317 [Cyclostephanos tholiformis]|uniref:Pseudouridine synthase RsuA/RluA-like domain-containing protein n=1 Tax=Cyclostephanos tholiformis TaxID=382380 RepID=A0ABD3SR84_9STRA
MSTKNDHIIDSMRTTRITSTGRDEEEDASVTLSSTTTTTATIHHHKTSTVRLSDRVAELGLCHRDDAERILMETTSNSMFNAHANTHHRGNTKNKIAEEERRVIYVSGNPIFDGREFRVKHDETDIEIHTGMPIRLSKRMSELGVCSRREAAEILREVHDSCGGSGNDDDAKTSSSLRHLEEVIYLRGKPVLGGAAVKVSPGERYVEIRPGCDPPPSAAVEDRGGIKKHKEYIPYPDRPWEEIMGDTVVLNKPVGYVSGQEEHQHVPAVRLLNRRNMHLMGGSTEDYFDAGDRRAFIEGNVLHFDKWKFSGYDLKSNSTPKRIRETIAEGMLRTKTNGHRHDDVIDETLSGYAPAGRLDIDSTGVILFTRAGIMARRLIEPESRIRKEYIVTVRPAVQLTSREIEIGLRTLPRPTKDLTVLLKHGNKLAGDKVQLKPLISAQWISDDKMRLVLVEGKKRQIRRMCREFIGWHVVELVRTSVGPVKIDTLPEGKWRPITRDELRTIFHEMPDHTERSNAKSDDEKNHSDGAASYETAASPSDAVGRGGIISTLARRGISEEKVMRVALDALRKEAGPDG